MAELLSSLLPISTLIFAVTSMLSVGLRYSAHEIIEPLGDLLRRPRQSLLQPVEQTHECVSLTVFGFLPTSHQIPDRIGWGLAARQHVRHLLGDG